MANRRFKLISVALAALSFSLAMVGLTSRAGASNQVPGCLGTHCMVEGLLPPGFGGVIPARCPGADYVERGANHTVPKTKIVVESFVEVGPIVATDTVPNEFGSRAVTAMSIVVANVDIFSDQMREFHITWWCTPHKDKAWLVFG